MNTRKSAFTGLNPVTNPSPPPLQHLGTPSTPAHTKMPPESKRFTVRLPVDLIEKIRTATLTDGVPRGIRGQSAWVADVLQEEIRRIEERQGHPLDRTPAGIMPTGWDAHTPKEIRND